MAKEDVDLEIILNSASWEEDGVSHVPKARVYFNDEIIFDDFVYEQTKASWEGELEEDKKHSIVVEMYNKDINDTIADSSGSPIEGKNMMLIVEKVLLCGIDTEIMVFNNSTYYPDSKEHPDKEPIENCTHMGWNGKWVFEFESPIYIWLLENL